MPRFYFEIKNIVHRILLNVCVWELEKKNKTKTKQKQKQRETDERKKSWAQL